MNLFFKQFQFIIYARKFPVVDKLAAMSEFSSAIKKRKKAFKSRRVKTEANFTLDIFLVVAPKAPAKKVVLASKSSQKLCS